ncbi:ligase-associated DNA damage response DEXH box helicase [Stieleria sp. ICT_E10.1]|uniref:ligase-associated DNA damage response DEXH box helicase n=1 Tax=Stieleria sedimenti TaxID=2976331 RepID=UPI0021804A31|nr:ligase-associated DNA damage response DEXH box helicase [Stieleria sedimenti]MCS7466206.1 ligase-associated DNA damage response DEXH box helicase [Stieleria sedimenti]
MLKSENETPSRAVDRYFASLGWKPFRFQRSVWRAYQQGASGLVHSATGTGKTLAVWLGPILKWLRENPDRSKWNPKRPPPLKVIWITPLRALAGDTESSLRSPLEAMEIPWRLESRTGDSKASVKARQLKRLPTALITTPESLSLMLTHEKLLQQLAGAEAVIVDEWHELLGTKRGIQTELALARLRRLNPAIRIWGVSATLGNLDQARHALVGVESEQPVDLSPHALARGHAAPLADASGYHGHVDFGTSAKSTGRGRDVRLVQGYKRKRLKLQSLIPDRIDRFPWSGHIGTKMVPQVAELVDGVNSVLIFANTRSQTEIWYQQLLAQRPDWAGRIALHHGSLDRSVRRWVEDGLREGSLRAVVCTSSLDLGVDFTAVDLVIQIGSPKGAARLLQRAGRSGHQPDAESRLAFVPTNAIELIELAAAQDAIKKGHLEARPLINKPLDVLAQHVVTIAIGGGFRSDALLDEIRSSYAYQSLSDEEWRWVLDFVVHGGSSLTAYPEFHRVKLVDGRYQVSERRTITAHRMNIGTIVSDASMTVKYLKGTTLGTAEESFLSKLEPGDRFLFAGRLLSLVRIKDNAAYVKRATGSPDTVPRWMGGRIPLSSELSAALRGKIAEAAAGELIGSEMKSLRNLLKLQQRWSVLPKQDELLVERIRSRGRYQLFLFPFEGRLVHEGLAALFAYRISRYQKTTLTMACNDYGLVLESPHEVDVKEAIERGLFSTEELVGDLYSSMNATEMAKRQFRQIARVAGLIHPGYPGQPKKASHLQASSNLFFDVFHEYDPNNLLLQQSRREVLEFQLEANRMLAALDRIGESRVLIQTPRKVTPLAFPLLVDKLRERVSSESLRDRVARMQAELEKAADRTLPGDQE